jgi:hypothetical protein
MRINAHIVVEAILFLEIWWFGAVATKYAKRTFSPLI